MREEDKESTVVYIDDILGTLGTWFMMEPDPAIPQKAMEALITAYDICAKTLKEE